MHTCEPSAGEAKQGGPWGLPTRQAGVTGERQVSGASAEAAPNVVLACTCMCTCMHIYKQT